MSKIPECKAIVKFAEPQGDEEAAKRRAGYITEIAFTDALQRKDIKKISYESKPIGAPASLLGTFREIEGVKI